MQYQPIPSRVLYGVLNISTSFNPSLPFKHHTQSSITNQSSHTLSYGLQTPFPHPLNTKLIVTSPILPSFPV
ncbi:uncharacterized protein SETTUDRAFT_168045 [Exserohilum turcica Et28A]|uniref:Uncharacterized protein n=1 Tax=Exserohilum turcicum (strain 28A) TaxID=671987 RepID=R0KLF8_EXST2|nr:uncharacterized protein SETTUDRAFT_168045 [Exserohilum turcica Et28A]EOA88797.1 hypothetical protein SETTUDRAFT_168045 [Exserohilum turcica Et28A]